MQLLLVHAQLEWSAECTKLQYSSTSQCIKVKLCELFQFELLWLSGLSTGC